jgi:plastocyanin
MRTVALLIAGLAVASASAAADARKPVPRTRIQVVAEEYDFVLSRHVVKSGPATVQLANFGEDPHDLRLQRVGGTKVYRIDGVAPGESADLRLTLVRGRYTLWCAIGDHRMLGMEAQLLVKQRR